AAGSRGGALPHPRRQRAYGRVGAAEQRGRPARDGAPCAGGSVEASPAPARAHALSRARAGGARELLPWRREARVAGARPVIRLDVHPTPEGAAEAVARRVVATLAEARAAGAAAHVSLAGGTTPRRAYELLASMLPDAEAAHWWFGDERCVPPDDPDSNYRLVAESLLGPAGVPARLVHRMRGEDPPRLAATAYARELREVVPRGPAGLPVLDLALLGLG